MFNDTFSSIENLRTAFIELYTKAPAILLDEEIMKLDGFLKSQESLTSLLLQHIKQPDFVCPYARAHKHVVLEIDIAKPANNRLNTEIDENLLEAVDKFNKTNQKILTFILKGVGEFDDLLPATQYCIQEF